MAFAFTTSWRVPPAHWPAALGDLWKTDFLRFNKPRFCKHGAGCSYDGVCSDVHPGEDGVEMRFFADMPHNNRRTGKNETSQIRLVGADGRWAPYYARRAQRKTWAQWSEEQGLPTPASFRAPPPPSADEDDSDIEGIVELDPEETELSYFAHVAQEKRLAELQVQAQKEMLAEQQRLFAQRQQAEALQRQQMMWALWQQQMFFAQQMAARAAPPVKTEAQLKAEVGDELYPLVQRALDRSAEDRAVIGFTGPLFTAGKIVGMLLEALPVPELRALLDDDARFSELMMDACDVLFAAKTPAVEVRENVQSATGCSAMAACAEDTVRELLEDVRRLDAGLPLEERPPSITVYEPGPGTSVAITRALLGSLPPSLHRQAVMNATRAAVRSA
jgi:hypothetical protein